MPVQVKQEKISPARAKKILDESSFTNRKINNANLDRHVRRMQRGEFMGLLNGPIVITDKKELIDGQHRLLAIIQTGTTQEMHVAYGASADDYLKLDNGTKAKTNNDILTALGFSYASMKAGAVNHYAKFVHYEKNDNLTAPKLMASEIEEIIDSYGDAKINSICKEVDKLGKWPRMAPVPTLGLLMYANKDTKDMTVLKEFVEGAAESKNIYEGDPRLLLQKFCSDRNRVHQRDKEIFYIMCWNAWLTGDSRKNLYKIDGKTKYPKPLKVDSYVKR